MADTRRGSSSPISLQVVGAGGPHVQDDIMAEVRTHLRNMESAMQAKTLEAGLTAYIRVVRTAAKNASPFRAFQRVSAYKWSVYRQSAYLVRGFVYARGYGNLLQSGADAHFAPIGDDVSGSGDVYAGLGRWMRKHAPDLLRRWGGKAKFAKVRARTGKPWVIPAADAVQGEAMAAFREAFWNKWEIESMKADRGKA